MKGTSDRDIAASSRVEFWHPRFEIADEVLLRIAARLFYNHVAHVGLAEHIKEGPWPAPFAIRMVLVAVARELYIFVSNIYSVRILLTDDGTDVRIRPAVRLAMNNHDGSLPADQLGQVKLSTRRGAG